MNQSLLPYIIRNPTKERIKDISVHFSWTFTLLCGMCLCCKGGRNYENPGRTVVRKHQPQRAGRKPPAAGCTSWARSLFDMRKISCRYSQNRQRRSMKSCGTVSRSCTGSMNARHSASAFGSAQELHMRRWRGAISPPLTIKGRY